ncbi:MAG: hypothetical protein K2N18_04115, partial [Clostridia bacterium]|nr:hypothetical protein [Clostridia bacterium]
TDFGTVVIKAGNGGFGANGGDGEGSYCDGAASAGNGGEGGDGGKGGNGIVASSLELEFDGTLEISITAGNGGVGGNGGDGGEGRNKGKADDGGDGGKGGNGGSGGSVIVLATVSNLTVDTDDRSKLKTYGGNGAQGGFGGRGGDAYEEGTRKAYSGDGGLAGNNGNAGMVISADNKNYAVNNSIYKNGAVPSQRSKGGERGDAHHGHAGTSHDNDYGAQGIVT